MTEQDKFDYVPIVKIENKLYAEGLTSTRKVSIIVNECIQHPCFRGFWIRDDRGPEWYHNVCVCRVAQFLAMGKKIEARFEFPQLENKEQKPDNENYCLWTYNKSTGYTARCGFTIKLSRKESCNYCPRCGKEVKVNPVESKSDSRKLPEFWYKFVNTGLTFKGHPVFLGPTFGGRKADTVDLTLLDKFIKRHMPSVYELLSVDGLPIVEGALE